MSDLEFSDEKQKGQFSAKFLLIFGACLIISTIGIFAASVYLFSIPGITSGIVFGLAILLLFVGPMIFGIVYYFKKLRVKDEEETDKKEIIQVHRVE
ncbi:MAG: hypothetical protein ACTSPT_06995 [Candidatus Heimdallarchaeota archaeon]